MSARERELWAYAVAAAFSEIIPTWPKGYTPARAEAATFYTLWLAALGYRLWDFY